MEMCQNNLDHFATRDYYPYAIHNLIESTFAVIKSKVDKKNWVEAFYAIEALTVFFEFESVWASKSFPLPRAREVIMTHLLFIACDDGDLARSTNNLYGALLLTILKGLQNTNQLTPKIFLNLETVLRTAHTFGELMDGIACKSNYTTACKAIANKLFKDTAAADQALYEARLREHMENIQDPEERKEMLEEVEEYLEEMKEEETVWYMKGKVGKDEIKNTGLARAWNEYKGRAPAAPMKGPPEWDLTKWTEKDKRAFSFDNIDDEF